MADDLHMTLPPCLSKGEFPWGGLVRKGKGTPSLVWFWGCSPTLHTLHVPCFVHLSYLWKYCSSYPVVRCIILYVGLNGIIEQWDKMILTYHISVFCRWLIDDFKVMSFTSAFTANQWNISVKFYFLKYITLVFNSIKHLGVVLPFR